MVAGTAGRRLPGRIPQVLAQLGTQRGLDHPTGELRQQPARPGDLVRPKPAQRVLQRVVGQQTREPIPSLLNGTLVGGGTRRLIPLILNFCVDIGGLSRPKGPRRSPRPHTERRTEPAKTDKLDARVPAELARRDLVPQVHWPTIAALDSLRRGARPGLPPPAV
jgi:hypothetical protein